MIIAANRVVIAVKMIAIKAFQIVYISPNNKIIKISKHPKDRIIRGVISGEEGEGRIKDKVFEEVVKDLMGVITDNKGVRMS